jgi:ArsR family transcriptional regulator
MSRLVGSRVDRGTELSRSRRRRLARVFHALSDETRLGVVEQLLDGERCVCELVELLGMAQSRLSFHLATLKRSGLVRDRREGRWVHYALVPEAVGELVDYCSEVCERARCCSSEAARQERPTRPGGLPRNDLRRKEYGRRRSESSRRSFGIGTGDWRRKPGRGPCRAAAARPAL